MIRYEIVKCIDCGNTMENSDAVRHCETESSEFWGMVQTTRNEYYTCPFCGGLVEPADCE